MMKKKQKWRIGDFFKIPLRDTTYCAAQIVGHEKTVLNSVTIAILDYRTKNEELNISEIAQPDLVFSALFTTRDLLDSARWPIIGHGPSLLEDNQLPYEGLRKAGFIGAKIRGSANVEDFVNAFYGLAAWDSWHDPSYLDSFLLSPEKKPNERLVYSKK